MGRIHLSGGTVVMLLAFALAISWAAGVRAQEAEEIVTVTGVESQGFPQVAADLLVTGATGPGAGPGAGLTAADFRVFEDGIPVRAEVMTVSAAPVKDVPIVLGLDLSARAGAEAAWLVQLKASALAFIDSLPPSHPVALLRFHDDVGLLQDFTTDRQRLRTTIEGLGIDGANTAINAVAYEAAALLRDKTGPRKAAVLLTNSASNFGPRSAEEAIAEAQQGQTPIYLIGFDIADPLPLETLAQETGGRAYVAAELPEIQTDFDEISRLLQQGGYQLTFQSGLQADDAAHDLAICVRCEAGQAEPVGQFTAQRGEVAVSLLRLAESQTVAGTVNLAVETTAPANITSVLYRLDGQILAEVTEPPYSYAWDANSAAPGGHRLTADAVDAAGNRGSAGLTLNVAAPMALRAAVAQPEVTVGDELVVTAAAAPLAEITQLELLVDGQPVASSDTPLYRFALDSGSYPPGDHSITVRALDNLGREAISDVQVRILEPPPSGPEEPTLNLFGRLRVSYPVAAGAAIAAALLFLALDIVGLVAATRRHRRRREQKLRLELTNLSNMFRRYALWTQENSGALRFQFLLNGIDLPRQSLLAPPPAPTPPAPAAKPQPAGRPSAKKSARKASESVRGINSAIGTVGSALVAVGAMIPGVGGALARRAAQPAFQAQQKIGGVQSRVQIQTGQVNYLSNLTGAKLPAGSQGQDPAQIPAYAGSTAGSATGSASQSDTIPSNGCRAQRTGEIWHETPNLAPGETLAIDLVITPANPYRTRRYPFRVASMALESPSATLGTEDGEIQVLGIPWLRRALPYFIFAIVAAAVLLGVGYYLMLLGILT